MPEMLNRIIIKKREKFDVEKSGFNSVLSISVHARCSIGCSALLQDLAAGYGALTNCYLANAVCLYSFHVHYLLSSCLRKSPVVRFFFTAISYPGCSVGRW